MSESPCRRGTRGFPEERNPTTGAVQQGKRSQGGVRAAPALQQPPSYLCPASGRNACAVGPWHPTVDTAPGQLRAFPGAQPILAAGSEKGLLNAQLRHTEPHLPKSSGPQAAAAVG